MNFEHLNLCHSQSLLNCVPGVLIMILSLFSGFSRYFSALSGFLRAPGLSQCPRVKRCEGSQHNSVPLCRYVQICDFVQHLYASEHPVGIKTVLESRVMFKDVQLCQDTNINQKKRNLGKRNTVLTVCLSVCCCGMWISRPTCCKLIRAVVADGMPRPHLPFLVLALFATIKGHL